MDESYFSQHCPGTHEREAKNIRSGPGKDWTDELLEDKHGREEEEIWESKFSRLIESEGRAPEWVKEYAYWDWKCENISICAWANVPSIKQGWEMFPTSFCFQGREQGWLYVYVCVCL